MVPMGDADVSACWFLALDDEFNIDANSGLTHGKGNNAVSGQRNVLLVRVFLGLSYIRLGGTLFGSLINTDISVGASGAIFGLCGAFV